MVQERWIAQGRPTDGTGPRQTWPSCHTLLKIILDECHLLRTILSLLHTILHSDTIVTCGPTVIPREVLSEELEDQDSPALDLFS